jgi:eukaryotic-like serine/threonine-protein kinase
MPEPNQVVADRYRLDRLLGEGGMGSVWAATHIVTRKRVAMKFLKATRHGGETLIRRFLREARAVSAVNHPNVVEVHDVLQLPDGMPVMVMDLLNGGSLGERLARSGSFELGELARILVPVISAVGTAHAAGIVHRDLKPDNIMLHERTDGITEPKVLDFGIAKFSATEGEAAATAHLTNTGAVLGTPYYMAPEQVFGEKDVDQRADVWSMGVILYECLSGVRPIAGENFGQLFKAIAMGRIVPLEQVAPQLPADITRLVARMLEPDRKRRCFDLREAYSVLSRYSSDKAISFAGAAAHTPSDPGSLAGSADSLPAADSSAPNHAAAQTDRSASDGGLAFEATGVADGSIGDRGASSPGVFSRTSPEDGAAPVRPRSRTPLYAAVAIGVTALLGGSAALLLASSNRDPRAGASAEPSVVPVAPSIPAETTTAANAPAVGAIATAAPSARGEVDSGVSPSGNRVEKPKRSPTASTGAREKPEPKPAEPTPAPTPEPAKQPGKLPGSVVSDVPF